MKNIFISNIKINKVRHLSDIEIPLSETERKHLILTGKNGSGKTSVLEAMRDFLRDGIEEQTLLQLTQFYEAIEYNEKIVKELSKSVQDSTVIKKTQESKNDIDYFNRILENFNKIWLEVNSFSLIEKYKSGNFLLTYFNSKRLDKVKTPNGIKKFDFKDKYSQTDKANENFLQHIVNLKADKSFARDDKDSQTVQQIENWFSRFENWLKSIFDDENLSLQFDRKKYTFNIILTDNIIVNFETLSDGYSALLNIVMELMMRMESKTAKIYDMQGIVLIDEIETHLHIDLQKKVLPFLTGIFPNIQFIVTTHSPFVLNSIENAVICDLEKNIVVEDLSAYAIDGIVEGYFDNDKYSLVIKNKINRYETLVNKASKTEEEVTEMFELRRELKKVPANLSPELVVEFQRIELNRLTVLQH